MTRTTNARLAGVTFLFCIAAGVMSLVTFEIPVAFWLIIKGVAAPASR